MTVTDLAVNCAESVGTIWSWHQYMMNPRDWSYSMSWKSLSKRYCISVFISAWLLTTMSCWITTVQVGVSPTSREYSVMFGVQECTVSVVLFIFSLDKRAVNADPGTGSPVHKVTCFEQACHSTFVKTLLHRVLTGGKSLFGQRASMSYMLSKHLTTKGSSRSQWFKVRWALSKTLQMVVAVVIVSWWRSVPPQASLGGRVRLMITGAAPISPSVLTFLRAAIGCQVKTFARPHVFAFTPSTISFTLFCSSSNNRCLL